MLQSSWRSLGAGLRPVHCQFAPHAAAELKRYREAAIPSGILAVLLLFFAYSSKTKFAMRVHGSFAFTRALIDVESITGFEKAVGEFLFAALSKLAASTGGVVERMAVGRSVSNVLAAWGSTLVTLSTHMDTVRRFSVERGR